MRVCWRLWTYEEKDIHRQQRMKCMCVSKNRLASSRVFLDKRMSGTTMRVLEELVDRWIDARGWSSGHQSWTQLHCIYTYPVAIQLALRSAAPRTRPAVVYSGDKTFSCIQWSSYRIHLKQKYWSKGNVKSLYCNIVLIL